MAIIAGRRGVSLVELFVVLGIVAILIALLFPALQAARSRARDAVCMNNVYQTNVALGQYLVVMKRVPPPAEPGEVGGWMVSILPFLERSDQFDVLRFRTPLSQAPAAALKSPAIYRCLVREAQENLPPNTIQTAHFAMIPYRDRKGFSVVDVPVSFSAPWLSSPELSFASLAKGEGPHRGSYFIGHGMNQGVELWDPLP